MDTDRPPDDPDRPAAADPWRQWWAPAGSDGGTPPPSRDDVPPREAPGPSPDRVSKRSGPRAAITGLGIAVIVAATILGVRTVTSRTATKAAANATPAADNAGSAASGGSGRRGTAGTLTSVKGSTLTVKTAAGQTVTVKTSSSTTVTRSAPASVGDIRVGDRVTVRSTSAATNTVVADRIVDRGTTDGLPGGPAAADGGAHNGQQGQGDSGSGAPADGGNNTPRADATGAMTAGTVSSVNGTTITVTGSGGTVTTVTTTPSTVVTVFQPSTLAALAVGQTVRVTGVPDSSGTVTASALQEGADTFGRSGGDTPPASRATTG